MVYWQLYGTKETVNAGSCSFFFFFIEGAKRQLCFPDVLLGRDVESTQSLWQVIETDRHADITGEADVDAEVDQPLFAWA